MKKTVQVLTVLALLASLICVASAQQPDELLWGNVLSCCIADVDMDGKEEMLTIETTDRHQVIESGERYGNYLRIYKDFVHDFKTGKEDTWGKSKDPRGEVSYEFDLSYLKPLTVQTGDVNGDGKKEISLVVYKETEFHPVPAKRPFFYALTDEKLEKIWLGSRLSRPFTDFVLCDLDKDEVEEIVSMEKTKDGDTVIALYSWEGFGFDLVCETESFSHDARFTGNRHYEQKDVFIESGGQYFTVVKEGDRLVLQKK